jgi:hypothetical protein
MTCSSRASTSVGLQRTAPWAASFIRCVSPFRWGGLTLCCWRSGRTNIFIDTRTSLGAADRLTQANDRRVDRTRHAVYVDDLSILGTDRESVARLQAEYELAAQRADLAVKQSKSVPPSCTGVECMGLEVHGTDLTVGVLPSKLERLTNDTLQVVRRGTASGRELSRLVGRWTWACLVNRPALSVLNAVYRYIECAGDRVFDLWPSVRDECILANLAPLLVAELAVQSFPSVIATDASSTGLGVVATRVQEAVLRQIREQPRDPIGTTQPEINALLSARPRWRGIAAHRWRYHEPINRLELRAVKTAVLWALSHPCAIGSHLLVLSDSAVVVGALAKGRSSEQPLLRLMRSVNALTLAAGVRLDVRWIPTDVNPADALSRS